MDPTDTPDGANAASGKKPPSARARGDSEARLQSLCAKQRTEIARLTQLNEKLVEDNRRLLNDIKWMRGEL